MIGYGSGTLSSRYREKASTWRASSIAWLAAQYLLSRSGADSTRRAATTSAPCSPCRNWLTIQDCSSQRKVSQIGRPRRASGEDSNEAIAYDESSGSPDPNGTSIDQSTSVLAFHWEAFAVS